MQDDYWEQSTEPLACLCFVAPLLLVYELGIVWMGPAGLRNGADVWLREFLARLGLVELFFLPAATCGLLLAWHHLTHKDWSVRSDVVSGMVCESFLLGICLLIFAQLFAHTTDNVVTIEANANALSQADRVPHLLSFLGAGIYEELLFRLLLLSGLVWLCRQCGVGSIAALAFAVIATSLLFAAAHYQLFCAVGQLFTWSGFAFRVTAGAFFSLLFLRRGFGIAVGTHAVYDILVATVS